MYNRKEFRHEGKNYRFTENNGDIKSTQCNYEDFQPRFDDEITYIECIRSPTLPADEYHNYHERQHGSGWAATDADAGGIVNPAADIPDYTPSPYISEQTPNSGQVEFKEVSHTRGRNGSYVFLAVDSSNPLYSSLKAAHLRRKDFDDNATYAFGGVLILLGIVCIIMGVCSIAIKAYFYFVGTGIWCGVFLIICGFCAMKASHNIFMGTSNAPLYVCLVFAVLSIISAMILIVFAIIGLVYDNTETTLRPISTTTTEEGSLAVHIICIAVGLLALISSIIVVLVAGKYVYRRHHYTMVPRTLVKPERRFTEVDTGRLNDMNLNIRTENHQNDRFDTTTKFTNPSISVIGQNPVYNSYDPKYNSLNGNFSLKRKENYVSHEGEDDITIGMDIRT